MPMTVEELIENFSFIEDWEERYRYVIELGRELEPLAEEEMNDANKVQGCVSQVWLKTEQSGDSDNPVLTFRGDSDAHIVKGLVAIALATFSGKPAKEILTIDAEAVFDQIGLRDHLTPQRSNGLSAMIGRIKSDAQAALDGKHQ
nr:SufE family protein [uncultured Cohaesibacter sp.]